MAQLATAASLDQVDWASVDLVIECVPERLDIKQALFAELVRRARPDAVLASNSSSFPISAIGQGLATRERMLGLHFFMPAHLVPLVEVVMACLLYTSSRFQAAAWRAASRITHTPSCEIRPDSSAYGMKTLGQIMPRSGERQRSSASTPSTSPPRPASLGW